MIFCDDHPSNPIVFICTGNHNCKRKLCAQCQFEHKVASNKDFIPAQLFQKIIEEKIDQVKNHPKSLQDRIKKDFKSFIGETINILKIQLDIIIEQILQKFEQLEKEDQRYSNIFESGIHLLELSQQDLDFIIGILNNQLERWLIYKDNYCIQLNNTIKNFKKDAENYHQQINLVQEKIASMENQKCQGLKKFFTILQKTEFQISYSKDIKIIYQQDGEILKIDEIEIYQNKPESIINLEQIKHLTWKGQLDKNQKKVGNWYPLWKGETINAGGNYGDDGKKIGDWVELIDNFWDQAQVFEIGKYQNNYKCGIWDIIKNQKKIGGGEYIKNGIKNGNWTQLDNNYYEGKKVVYNGKYLDGKKCQKWNIILDGECIGGGSYDDDGQKDGEWRELHFNFNENNRITEIGIYKNGKKVGKWEIKNEGNQIIGEGTFDQCGLKNGNWVELHDYYSVQNQITYLGEYRNGKKCNRWDTKFKIEEEVVQEEIMRGYYNLYEQKNQNWLELHDNFNKQIKFQPKIKFFIGDLNRRILELEKKRKMEYNFLSKCKLSGGGVYDEEGNKTGDWIELNQNFSNQAQLAYSGKYKNGKKHNQWDTIYRISDKQVFIKIGGGCYDENGLKDGLWIDIQDNYDKHAQVIFKGQYKNGRKEAKWDIIYKDQNMSKIQQIMYKILSHYKEVVEFNTFKKQAGKSQYQIQQKLFKVYFHQ